MWKEKEYFIKRKRILIAVVWVFENYNLIKYTFGSDGFYE